MRSNAERLDSLSNIEREILLLMVQGYSVPEISKARFVTVATTRSQVKNILRKLDVNTQLKAVAVYHRTYRKPK